MENEPLTKQVKKASDLPHALWKNIITGAGNAMTEDDDAYREVEYLHESYGTTHAKDDYAVVCTASTMGLIPQNRIMKSLRPSYFRRTYDIHVYVDHQWGAYNLTINPKWWWGTWAGGNALHH